MFKFLVLCATFTYVTCVYRANTQYPKILKIWSDFPSKTLMNITAVQPKCQKAYQNFLNLLDTNDLHAVKMLDSTAKLPSGILNGNIIQYGDFDQCMDVPTAQYCLAEIDLEPLWKEPYLQYKNLVHSFYFFKETFSDPAHRIPGFSMARWGFCIPSECSSEDLKTSLETNFGVLAQIRPGMCQKSMEDTRLLTLDDYIARLFFCALFLTILVASSIDYYTDHFAKEENIFTTHDGTLLKIIMSFSFQRNLTKFLEIKENDDKEILGLHGVRALNALALLMSHKAISLFFNPYMNRTATIESINKPWTIIAKNAIVYTDSFLVLSGLLNANSLFTALNHGRPMNFKEKLINRIFRILPNFLALIVFCTYILPSLGSGPLWPVIINHHSVLCKKYMWRNIFFVHNYFGFEDMCLTHTHQLGIDMQLFLITPIMVYLIWTFRQLGFLMVGLVAAVSTILRFWVAYENELSPVIYFGTSVSKMFSMANLSYILPTHRATVYLMGVFLAYLLKFSKRQAFNKLELLCLWSFFLPLFLGSWLGAYHMATMDYVYDRLEASLINAIYPILWGSGITFGIYAVNKHIAGWLGKFLCWKYFQIVTKLAYAIYLVQFPVFFYNVGLTRNADEYQPRYRLPALETMGILLCALALVLFIEMPFQNIRQILFDKTKYTKVLADSTKRKIFKSG